MIWHSSDTNMVVSELGSDKENGLDSTEVLKRLELYGKNEIHDFEKPSFVKLLLKQLSNYLNIIFLCTAVIYLIITLVTKEVSWTEPLLIILILCINFVTGTAINYRNIVNVDRLRNSHTTYATVVRDGIEQIIPSSNLVPGDIMILSTGDFVPADGRIIDAYVFICDEFSVTGETVPIEKMPDMLCEDITPLADRVNMVYSGSFVQSGRATVIVTETGEDTAIGRAESIVKQTRIKTTPLHTRLQSIGRLSAIVSLIAAAVVFFVGIIANISDYEIGFETTVLSHLLLGLSLAVSAIPEGLGTILTIAVAFSASRLKSRNITFINLPSAESIGATSVICTDKTGTLTDENMNLVKISDGKNIVDLTSNSINESTVTLLHLALICSNLNEREHTQRHSNAIESAIERASAKATGMSKTDIDGIYPRLAELPFDSHRGLMTTVTVINTKPYAIIKGAPEVILQRSLDIDAEAVTCTIDSMADEGLMVLAVALKPLDEIPANPNSEELENDLVFVGLLAFDNPPDPLCVREIAECKAKGIRVVMLTGDYTKTAVSVAKTLGIISDSSQVISHSELEKMSDEELSEKVSDYSVFARITSEDKLRVVRALRSCSEQVLLTCDSVRDVPALVEADYGCALGITGSDSVKASADFIVNDNKFSTLILALKESNRIFDSVLRSVKYLISCNAAEIITVLFGLIIFGTSPLTAAALLWINLITDLFPALAFSAEVSSSTLSLRRHESRQLIGVRSTASMAVPAVVISVLTLIAYGIGLLDSPETAATLSFAVISICEIVHAFALSHTYTVFQKGTVRNLVMPIACLLSLFIVFFVIITPVGSLLSFTTLDLSGWLMILISAVITLATGETVKYISKRLNK